jgi:hypothetical protein
MTQNSNVLVIEGKANDAPDFVVKSPTDDGKWVNVGVAFYNPKSQFITVYFNNAPDTQKVVMFRK